MATTNIIPPSLRNPICTIQMQKTGTPPIFGTPVLFTHTDSGSEVDAIDTNVEITRDVVGWLFNPLFEAGSGVNTPTNTQWHYLPSPLQNYTSATVTGLAYQSLRNEVLSTFVNFNQIVGKDFVMHDTANNKYYLFSFSAWTSGGGGGGFEYTRTEILTFEIVICDGAIRFHDNTYMDTAPTINGTVNRVAMFTPNGTSVGNSLIEISPIITVGTNVLTGSDNCLVVGNNISAVNASTSFIYGSNSNIDNALECFVVGHNNIDFSGGGTVFSCIVLGNLTTFLGAYSAGIYTIGDTNKITASTYCVITGQNNTLSATFSSIHGAYNNLATSSDTTIIGRYNTISNGSTTTIVGQNNSISASLANTVVVGKDNTSVLGNAVNLLNANFGLKIRATASGIGGAGFTPTARFQVRGIDNTTGISLRIENLATNPILTARNDGRINMAALPVSAAGLSAGDLWNNVGVVNIV